MTQLSDPLTLVRGGVLPNRLAKSAMSERVATRDGRVTEELVRLYERWASGGTGLLITGNVMVDATAIGEEGNVIVEDDRDLPGLRAWARAAKSGARRCGCRSTTRGASPRGRSRRGRSRPRRWG